MFAFGQILALADWLAPDKLLSLMLAPPHRCMFMRHIAIPVMLTLLGWGCTSTTKRLDSGTDMLADSGELTRGELEKAAGALAEKVRLHFTSNVPPDGLFVAFLPTKNDTSDQLPVNVFDNRVVGDLLTAKIYTVRVEDRNKALSEIAFSQTGATANGISAGKMRSPNYFIQAEITENLFKSGGDRIVEQVLNFELRSVETQLVVFSDRIVYRKKPRNQKGGVTW